MAEKREGIPRGVRVVVGGIFGTLLTVVCLWWLIGNITLATKAQRAAGTVLESHHLARSA